MPLLSLFFLLLLIGIGFASRSGVAPAESQDKMQEDISEESAEDRRQLSSDRRRTNERRFNELGVEEDRRSGAERRLQSDRRHE